MSAWLTSGLIWHACRLRSWLLVSEDAAFYKAKLQTARFYFELILPRTRTHVATMLSGASNLMDMAEEDFALGY